MRSYNSLNSRTLNVLVKNSNTLATVFQSNYLGNTVASGGGGSEGGGGGNTDLSGYALKTDVDGSFNNVYTKAYVDGSFNNVYTKAYVDASINSLNTKLYTLTNGALESLDTLAEISSAIKGDASFGFVVYEKIASSDLSINSIVIKNTAQDVSINNVYTKSYIDNSFGNVYTKSYVDNSFNALTTTDFSLNSRLNVGGDASFNSKFFVFNDVSFNSKLFLGGDASFNSKLRVGGDASFNGNLQLGSSVSINKEINTSFALDVSGAANIVGNLSVTKRPSDISYSYFDLSSVNLNIFNTIEKFTTLTFAASLTMNYSQGSIFYVSGSGAFTGLAITNVPTTLNRSVTVTLISAQSSTSFFAGTAVTVNGTSITYIKQDGTAFAAPAASRTVIIYQFTIIYASATPTVIAFMTGYS